MIKECLRLTDDDLSRVGRERIEWAWRKMPVLKQIKDEWEQSLPLKGLKSLPVFIFLLKQQILLGY